MARSCQWCPALIDARMRGQDTARSEARMAARGGMFAEVNARPTRRFLRPSMGCIRHRATHGPSLQATGRRLGMVAAEVGWAASGRHLQLTPLDFCSTNMIWLRIRNVSEFAKRDGKMEAIRLLFWDMYTEGKRISKRGGRIISGLQKGKI